MRTYLHIDLPLVNLSTFVLLCLLLSMSTPSLAAGGVEKRPPRDPGCHPGISLQGRTPERPPIRRRGGSPGGSAPKKGRRPPGGPCGARPLFLHARNHRNMRNVTPNRQRGGMGGGVSSSSISHTDSQTRQPRTCSLHLQHRLPCRRSRTFAGKSVKSKRELATRRRRSLVS